MAHIIARKESFTRGDLRSLSEEELDQVSNLILVCSKHHKVIDDQPAEYTVDKLRAIKAAHENWVCSSLEAINSKKQFDDELYAAIADE